MVFVVYGIFWIGYDKGYKLKVFVCIVVFSLKNFKCFVVFINMLYWFFYSNFIYIYKIYV